MEKCLKPIQKTETENVNLATQVKQHYVGSKSLTRVHSKVTTQQLYTIFHKLSCKSKVITYLMECIKQSPLCWKIQNSF